MPDGGRASTIVLLLTMALRCAGQETAFEVASIKRNLSGSDAGSVRIMPGARLVAKNATLQSLITAAWQIRNFELSGGPSWLTADRFDVEAKAAETKLSNNQVAALLQALLADRFSLKVHRETREMPVYRLVTAKSGPALTPAREGNCTSADTPPAQIDLARFRPCGGFNIARDRLTGTATTERLAATLGRILGRNVLDQTGTTGTYDILLRWTPDDPQTPRADDSAPSLFTAIQEQLGLRLEADRGPVEILVIDRVERPSGN
jgi:uncharacterized protein (TIGR03435 family)